MQNISILEDISLTDKSLSGEYRTYFEGIIPTGSNNFNFPLRQIASVRFHHKRDWKGMGIFIVGAFLSVFLVPAIFEVSDLFGIVTFFIGLFLAYRSFVGVKGLFVSTSGGDSELIISYENNDNIKKFITNINNAIAENS